MNLQVRISSIAALVTLGLAGISPRSYAQTDINALAQTIRAYHYGSPTAPLEEMIASVSAARSSPTAKQAAARALAAILAPGATFEAREFACRQLALVGTEEQAQALADLLAEPELAHYALYALSRIPGAGTADILVKALPTSRGAVRSGILDTLADFGDARLVQPAAYLLRDDDDGERESAASALAKLGTAAAISVLQAAYSAERDARRVMLGHALAQCAARLRQRGETAPALAAFELLLRDSPSPALASAATNGIVAIEAERSVPTLLKALGRDGTREQRTAAALLRGIKGQAATEKLAASLTALRGNGRLLAIQILADRGDAVAAPAILALCSNPEPAVREAALRAAGAVCDAAAVDVLLKAAVETSTRSAARAGLVRLRGAAADRALLAAAETGKPATQVQAIQILGLRNALGIAPRLLKAAASPNVNVSSAALRVLRDQAPTASLPALIELLLAKAPDSRYAAIEAVAAVARRTAAAGKSTTILFERLLQARKPEDKVSLIGAAGQIGGQESLSALRRSLAEQAVSVKLAALTALSEWPTDEPVDDLLRAARTAPDDTQRTIALRGYIRMVTGSEQRTLDQIVAALQEILPLAHRPAEKRIILAGIARTPSREALALGVKLTADPDVRAEAELATAEIGRVTIGAWQAETTAALTPIASAGVNDEAKRRAAAALAAVQRFGDFVMAWEVSPPYQRDGADFKALFDLPFDPEQAPDRVAWRPLAVGGAPEQPWLLDILAQWPGEQRVAYLRTNVWSESERDLNLELGSDDGIKAWVNDALVVADNTARAAAPAQEKATVHLKQGWNRLLLKVTQNNQGWGACARFTASDGGAATGLRYAVGSRP